ncbi:MAG: type II toxin-antitoxin system Phd/YefM family antitoxin [Alphaproteobacteria bacterium]
MHRLSAKDAKDCFGQLLDSVRSEPAIIEKYGRKVAVVLSYEEYQWLEALEDALWVACAEAGEASGYLSSEGSERLLNELGRAAR